MRGFEDAAASLRRLLDEHSLDAGVRNRVELVFEEIATNIIRHAAPRGEIDASVRLDDREVVLTFEDDGMPFDPCAGSASAGYGLTLVRKMASRLEYQRTTQQRNRLRVAIARA